MLSNFFHKRKEAKVASFLSIIYNGMVKRLGITKGKFYVGQIGKTPRYPQKQSR